MDSTPPAAPTPDTTPTPEPTPAPAPTAAFQPTAVPTGVDPGKTLAIVGLILDFFVTVVGLILSIVALNKSKKAGYKNTIALVGLIIGIITTIGSIIGTIAVVGLIATGVTATANATQACSEQGNVGTVVVSGVTFNCDNLSTSNN